MQIHRINPEFFDGSTKSIPLNELPEQAWRVISGQGDGSAADTGAVKSAAELRRVVGVLRRCIDIRAAALMSVPWTIYKRGTLKPVWTSEDSLPPSDLEWMGDLKKLLMLTEESLILTATAFWHIERSLSQMPLELRWLAPLSVKPIWTEEDGITSFERSLSKSRKVELDPKNVVYIWIADPMHETKPDSPVADAAVSAAGTLFSIDRFAKAFFDRGAIKGTLLTVEGNPAPSSVELLRTWWRKAFNGVQRAFGTEVVNASVKPVVVGEGIGDLNNSTLTDEQRETIATALGVPHSMIMSNAANYATSSQDKRNFYDETIVPELQIIEPMINEQLFAQFDLTFNFQVELLDLYQEDENQRADAFTKYVGSGMPVEVVGEMLGIELPNGMKWSELQAAAEAPAPADKPFNPADNFAGSQPQVDLNEQDAVAKSRTDDLAAWRRKSLRRWKKQGVADCPFESDTLQPKEIAFVRTFLANATVQSDINNIFDIMLSGPSSLGARRRFAAWVNYNFDANKSFTLNDYPHYVDGFTLDDARKSLALLICKSDNRADEVARQIAEWDEHETLAQKALTLQANPDDEDAETERNALASVERRATTNIAAGLEKQGNEIIKGNESTLTAPPEDVDMTALLGAPDRVTAASGTASDALRAALIESADLGVSMASDQLDVLKLAFDWTLANHDARDWAHAHAAEAITGINATTERRVKQAIAQWIENGEPLSALVRELTPTFGRKRAELIASTETTMSYAQANRIAYESSGVVSEMKWATANDELVCPICGALNGQVVTLSEGFTAFAHRTPPAHVRCRCIVLPIIDRALIRQSVLGESNTPAYKNFFDDLEAANEYGAAQWSDWYNSLSDEDKIGINGYTGRAYSEINSALRSKRGLESARPGFQSIAQKLEAALAKAEVREPVEVVRSINKSVLAKVKVGDTITDKGFTSTSLFKRENLPASKETIVIRLPAGTKGAYVGNVSTYSSESEIILQRGTQFKVIGIDNDGNRILEAIPTTMTKSTQLKVNSDVKSEMSDDRFLWVDGDLIIVRDGVVIADVRD